MVIKTTTSIEHKEDMDASYQSIPPVIREITL